MVAPPRPGRRSTVHAIGLVFPLPHHPSVYSVFGGPCQFLLSVACIDFLMRWFDLKLVCALGMLVSDSGIASGVSGGDGVYFNFKRFSTSILKSLLFLYIVCSMNKGFYCLNKAVLAMELLVLVTAFVGGSPWEWPFDGDVTVAPCWMGLIYVRRYLRVCWMEVVWFLCWFVLIPVEGINVALCVCFSDGVVIFGPCWVVMSTMRCCLWVSRSMALTRVYVVAMLKLGCSCWFWVAARGGIGFRFVLNKAVMALGVTFMAMVCMGSVGPDQAIGWRDFLARIRLQAPGPWPLGRRL